MNLIADALQMICEIRAQDSGIGSWGALLNRSQSIGPHTGTCGDWTITQALTRLSYTGELAAIAQAAA